MATITDFLTRVRIQIRDDGATQAFTDTELTQYIQDAVMDYSKYRPLKKQYTLNLVPNQTIYQLPTDWMTVDIESFERAITPQPLPDISAYVLPFIYVNHPLGTQLNTMKFSWYNDNQQLILASEPFTSYTLTFNYYAYHSVDSVGTTIPMQFQYKALLSAYEKALRAIATDYTVKLQKYKIGGTKGIEIDDSKIADGLLKQADDYRNQYRTEIVLRPYGSSGGNDNEVFGTDYGSTDVWL